MKKILLRSAAYLNGGAFVAVGTEVPVGTEKLEMTEERASDMVDAKLAERLADDEDAGEEDDEGEEDDAGDGLSDLKLEELKAIAASDGVNVAQARSKVDYVAAIRAHRG